MSKSRKTQWPLSPLWHHRVDPSTSHKQKWVTNSLGNTSKIFTPSLYLRKIITHSLFSLRFRQVFNPQVNISSVSFLNKDDLVSSHIPKLIQ